MSGYADDALVHHGTLDSGAHFIGRPFTATDLTNEVREVLEQLDGETERVDPDSVPFSPTQERER